MLAPIAAKARRVKPKALDGTSLYNQLQNVELGPSARRAVATAMSVAASTRVHPGGVARLGSPSKRRALHAFLNTPS